VSIAQHDTSRKGATHDVTPAPQMDTPLAAALYYRACGFSPLPINQANKKPPKDFLWGHLQKTPADEATIREWYARWPMAGVGIVTGAVSNLWVVDIDSADGYAQLAPLGLPSTPTVKTCKGEHRYYTRPHELRNTAKAVPGLDTRGDGGYVVAPPTIHPDGVPYTWEVGPWEVDAPLPPPALVALFTEPQRAAGTVPPAGDTDDVYASMLETGSPKGQRNQDMVKLVGHYIARGLGKREIAILLRPWVARCSPPFPEAQLDVVIERLAAADARNHGERQRGADPPPLHIVRDTDGEDVRVDPRFLLWLMREAGAALTLRVRLNRQIAIMADPVLNDGQKLAASALSFHLFPTTDGKPPAPLKVSAHTIARRLGAVEKQQKDGSFRLTKVNTVTKNLADIATYGVVTREKVMEPRRVTIADDRGKPVETTVLQPAYLYQDTHTLPGQRMTKEEAMALPTKAKAHREKPRCPRCFSDDLAPTAHQCQKCGAVSSDVDAMQAAEMCHYDEGSDTYTSTKTGERIVPGVVVDDFEPASAPETVTRADGRVVDVETGEILVGGHDAGLQAIYKPYDGATVKDSGEPPSLPCPQCGVPAWYDGPTAAGDMWTCTACGMFEMPGTPPAAAGLFPDTPPERARGGGGQLP